MRRSANEFCTALAKAGVASGFPPDIAEEVALAAVQISTAGGDGIAAAMRSLRRGMAAAAAPQQQQGEISYPRTSAAAVVTVAAEALCAAWHSKQPCRAHFAQIDSPALLAGLAAVAAQTHELHYALTFQSADGSTHTINLPQDSCLLPPSFTAGSGGEISARLEVAGKCRSSAPALPAQGMDVPAAGWEEVEQLAAQTKVPASDSSRAEGAGAGAIDND